MKPIVWIIALLVLNAFLGCSDRATAEKKAADESAAKAQLAASQEMKQLPETFKPRYNQKLDRAEAKPGAVDQPATTAGKK